MKFDVTSLLKKIMNEIEDEKIVKKIKEELDEVNIEFEPQMIAELVGNVYDKDMSWPEAVVDVMLSSKIDDVAKKTGYSKKQVEDIMEQASREIG